MILLVYLLRVFLRRQARLWWVLWLFLELISWTLILIISPKIRLRFLIWQSMCSLLLFYIIALFKSSACIFILLLFKIAIPPFHGWFVNILKIIAWKPFILFRLLNKFPLAIFFRHLYSRFYFLRIFLILFISFKFWILLNIKHLLWGLFLRDFVWLIFCSRNFRLLRVYLGYLMFSCFLFLFNPRSPYFNKILIFISGVPFFSLFRVKLIIIGSLNSLKILFLMCFNIIYQFFIWFFMVFINNFQNIFILKVSKQFFWLFLIVNMFWFYY